MNQFNPYNRMAPTQPSNLDWIMVQNISQVETVAVQPNSKAWIMVQNEPIFALRTADAMGLTSTAFYKFEKYEPQAAADYITRDELMTMLAELKEANNESNLQ